MRWPGAGVAYGALVMPQLLLPRLLFLYGIKPFQVRRARKSHPPEWRVCYRGRHGYGRVYYRSLPLRYQKVCDLWVEGDGHLADFVWVLPKIIAGVCVGAVL